MDDRKETLRIAEELIDFLTREMDKGEAGLKKKVTMTFNPFLQDSTLVSN